MQQIAHIVEWQGQIKLYYFSTDADEGKSTNPSQNNKYDHEYKNLSALKFPQL